MKINNLTVKSVAFLAILALMVTAGGSAWADEMVSGELFEISQADLNGLKAGVSGQQMENRVYSRPTPMVVPSDFDMASADLDRIRDLVSGKAALSDARVYSKSMEKVDFGLVTLSKTDFETLRDTGQMARENQNCASGAPAPC